VVARLRESVTLPRAQQDMLAVRASLADLIPASMKDWSVTVEPFDLRLVGDGLRRTLSLSFGAVIAVLLITCANIANLLLASGADRRKEMAVRAALGASRGRLVAQLLTESLALCVMGGGGGIAVAYVLMRVASPFLPPDLPSYAELSLNPRALAFASAVALGAALLVGIFPALRTSSGALTPAMNAAARGSSVAHERVRRLIVIGEVAMSMVLICAALLLARSLTRLQRVDLGASVDRILTMSVDLPISTYPAPARAVQFMDDAVARVQALPGVAVASMSSDVPLDGSGGEGLAMPGRPEHILVRFKRVDAGYFTAFDIPVLAGRAISRDDRPGSTRVVLVNATLARRLAETFGMADVVGRTVTLPALGFEERLGSPREAFQIVGVVGNERIRRDLRLPIGGEEAVYVALAQSPKRSLKVIVRTNGDPLTASASVREALKEVDPSLGVANVQTMAHVKAQSLSGVAEPTWVIGAFAAVALFLAALGLYGVLAHSVTQQRREIGIRLALGASAHDVLGRVAAQALVMIAIGLSVGLVGAFAFTRVTSSLLFQVAPFDPPSFAAAAAIMLFVGLVAASVPAIRASRVDPTTALQAE
jgi:predicted permease